MAPCWARRRVILRIATVRDCPSTRSPPARTVAVTGDQLSQVAVHQASPRGSEWKSIRVADAYLETMRAQNPMMEVNTIKLWQEDLLSFDEIQAAAKTKVMTGQVPTDAEKPAWMRSLRLQPLHRSRPLSDGRTMWKGGIPYHLKHYIDIIHQPGLTWGLNPKTGFFGLLKN
jgi:FMN-dependent NADH-azoreductase